MTALTCTETLSREMTSWVGTSSTMTRMSTLIIFCTTGTIRNSPGPLTSAQRPRVETTPRSYSGRILMEANITNSTNTTTTSMISHNNMTLILEREQRQELHALPVCDGDLSCCASGRTVTVKPSAAITSKTSFLCT